MANLTLLRRDHPLAEPARQVELLDRSEIPHFSQTLASIDSAGFARKALRILQINLGRVCNQTCRHCHVDAGPDRRESMAERTLNACIEFARHNQVQTIDITGGAPEMHPQFRWLVEQARSVATRVIDRCNLTILLAPGFTDLPEFLARNQVEIVASLPCYLEQNVDQQRGNGVFEASLTALRCLNNLGYGQPGSGLTLNLVFNPLGPSLPPPQSQLEADYHRELSARYGVVFNHLLTITNLPISRFLEDLVESNRLEGYLTKLHDHFNPATLPQLMCRDTLSVDWEGRLYDCDFNQMLNLPLHPRGPQTIFEALDRSVDGLPIVTGNHCYGCTAGAGSGCQGAIET